MGNKRRLRNCLHVRKRPSETVEQAAARCLRHALHLQQLPAMVRYVVGHVKEVGHEQSLGMPGLWTKRMKTFVEVHLSNIQGTRDNKAPVDPEGDQFTWVYREAYTALKDR